VRRITWGSISRGGGRERSFLRLSEKKCEKGEGKDGYGSCLTGKRVLRWRSEAPGAHNLDPNGSIPLLVGPYKKKN